jgi:hypothetical protein
LRRAAHEAIAKAEQSIAETQELLQTLRSELERPR